MKTRTGTDPMIIISLDAVGAEDLPLLRSLPNFGRFWREAAVCEQVKSVYPSLTYPAHTAIITGKYPCSHGIVNNLQIQPEREKPDWFWKRKYIWGETLYDLVRARGGRTAALLWPVTGGAGIRWNLPEVLPNRPWENQVMVSCLNGSPLFELDLQRRFGHLRKGVHQPELDNFVQASLLYTLRTRRPDLTLVHFTDVDTNRHLYGVKSREAEEALRRHDERLGEIFRLLGRMGWKDRVNVAVLGDHFQLDVNRAVCPNWYFARRQWLRAENGKIKSWRVLARECDGSCYVYIKDQTLHAPVRRLLEKLESRGLVRTVFTGREAAALGADPSCAFMLEGGDGVYFQNGWEMPIITEKTGRLQRATHGFLPDRAGYTTVFGGRGPAFAPKARVETMSLADEGATLAAAMGIPFSQADGEIQKNLLSISGDCVYNKK